MDRPIFTRTLRRGVVCTTALLGTLLLGACAQPTIFPNPDPNLRQSRAQLSADAAYRQYRTDAPRVAEVKARAEVHYSMNRLELVNFTGQDWGDVEVWINREYVCYVPKVEDRKLKQIHFPMLYNQDGKTFPRDNRRHFIRTVEVYRDGTMYSITSHMAD